MLASLLWLSGSATSALFKLIKTNNKCKLFELIIKIIN